MIDLSPNNKEIYKIFKKHRNEMRKYKESTQVPRMYPDTWGLKLSDIYVFTDSLFMSKKEVRDSLDFLTKLETIVYNEASQHYYYNEDICIINISPKELDKLLHYDWDVLE